MLLPRVWGEFVRAHPSGKNKDAAMMGHPEFLLGVRYPEFLLGMGDPVELLRRAVALVIFLRIGEGVVIRRFAPD
jgi:hypothetical protein